MLLFQTHKFLLGLLRSSITSPTDVMFPAHMGHCSTEKQYPAKNNSIIIYLLSIIGEPNIEVTGRAKRFWEAGKAYVARSRAAIG